MGRRPKTVQRHPALQFSIPIDNNGASSNFVEREEEGRGDVYPAMLINIEQSSKIEDRPRLIQSLFLFLFSSRRTRIRGEEIRVIFLRLRVSIDDKQRLLD